MRLRLRPKSPARTYRERVQLRTDGSFDSIRRTYDGSTSRITRAWLTPDVNIARAWAQCDSRAEGLRRLATLAPKNSTASVAVNASVFQDTLPDDALAVRELTRIWTRVGSVLPEVYQLRPGVWIHRTAAVDPGATILPPVWVGAHTNITSDRLVVGPAVVADVAPITSPNGDEIDWGTLRMPSWRFSPVKPHRFIRRLTKRTFDIVFSLCVLAVTLPFYPIVMLAIALEDGWPPFFTHKRQTMKGKPFGCLKFRSMCRDADQIKQEMLDKNEVDGPQFFVKEDQRVLRVGAILRRYQIDEFPQFFNVLLGHMSVVGPRPSPDSENQYCPTWREMRLGVRPGVTGLWQVKRTREPETDFQEWIRYDLEYVQHQSWRMDVWIIIQTIKRVIGG